MVPISRSIFVMTLLDEVDEMWPLGFTRVSSSTGSYTLGIGSSWHTGIVESVRIGLCVLVELYQSEFQQCQNARSTIALVPNTIHGLHVPQAPKCAAAEGDQYSVLNAWTNQSSDFTQFPVCSTTSPFYQNRGQHIYRNPWPFRVKESYHTLSKVTMLWSSI
jgi:hypothetical protein